MAASSSSGFGDGVIQFPAGEGTRWSVLVQDADTGETLLAHNPDAVLSTASVGKLFALHLLLADVDAGLRTLEDRVTRRPSEMVGGSGLWNLMQADTLSLHDLGVLIGAVSDNDATNSLLRVLGTERVRAHAATLGFEVTRLNDSILWPIPPGRPPRLSEGNATELVRLAVMIANGVGLNESSRDVLLGWLGAGADMSMVAQPFNFDPPDHNFYDRGVWLWNKTGTLLSVRADVGMAMSRDRRIAFAVLAEWESGADPRDAVLAAMADVGSLIRAELAPSR